MQKPPAFRRSAEAMENLGSDSKTSWTAVTDPNCEGERTADTFPETQPEAATEESNNTQHPQTRNPWHIAKRAWGTVHDTQHGGITRLEMVIVVVSIVLYIVDVGTDVQLAVRYFQHGERIYGGLTTAFITVAYLVVLVVGFGSYMGNYDVPGYWWACRITFLMLGLSPVVLSLEYMYYGWKGRSRAEERETCSETAVYSTILRLWESFLEAAPQLCFQLYIVFKEKPEERIATATLRGVAVFSSWASLAVTAVMFFKRHRIGLGETEKVNFTSQLFYFLWRVCETGGRVLCIALFASTFEYWVFAVLCSHYVIMVVWFIWVNSNRDSWAVLTCFLFGYVLLFYMPFHSRPSRYLHLFYYVIFHAENFLMLGLWAGMTSDRDAWFYIPVIVAVVVFFFLHIVMQVVYYKAFHPKSKDIDWCTTCDWKTVHQSLKNLRS